MTFHPFVIAYGQRRGYNLSDLDQLNQQLLFSSTNDQSKEISNFKIASDLTLNLMDSSVYLRELQLFSAFHNSLPASARQRLRSYVDGMIAYFCEKLSAVGQDTADITASLADFNFCKTQFGSEHSGSSSDGSSEVGQLLRGFLQQFRTPLIYEYFRVETDIFAKDMDDGGQQMDLDKESDSPEQVESEKEDNVEDPHWWKPNIGETEFQDSIDPNQDPKLESMLHEIRHVCSKSAESECDSLMFPYLMKLYNLSTSSVARGRNQPKPTAICADVTSDGTLACFGCDSDSSLRCFQLRHSPAVVDQTVVRAQSASGIIYRLEMLESTSLLLATSDDVSCPIQLFDMDISKKIYDYRGHRWPVWALNTTISGGGMFVTGSYDRTARVFLLEQKDPVRILVGHESSVDWVKFIENPSGTNGYPEYVATASSDRTVRIWALNDAVAVRVFHGIRGSPTALAYRASAPAGSPEKLVACATTEGKIFIWDLDSGRQYQIIEGVLANDMQFSADGQHLVAGGNGGIFKIYHLQESGGDFGKQYIEMHLSENLLNRLDSKFLRLKFIRDELICLSS